MPTTKLLPIKQLKLDLHNFRTVPQSNEENAIKSMIVSDPDWFWALMESLLKDGFHPTENIIVLKNEKLGKDFVVKEGNRRIGALKIIFGLISLKPPFPPLHIKEQIESTSKEWKMINQSVSCAIYEPNEAANVDRIISLIHGKGERAGRKEWNALARARHNRDKNGANEAGLDLLEKYLEKGRNLTGPQRERWSGDYPITVLDEVVKRFYQNFGSSSSRQLSEEYPQKVKERDVLENLLLSVGTLDVKFPTLRGNNDDYFCLNYGIPSKNKSDKSPLDPAIFKEHVNSQEPNPKGNGKQEKKDTESSINRKQKSLPLDDPKSVMRTLRKFSPKGANREKVVTLKNEALKLKLIDNPLAFCFLLRSMFEISAKAFCKDHENTCGIKYSKSDGTDKTLEVILREIALLLTKNNSDKQMKKILHGAMAVLGEKNGFLSVTSMNQLIHNPNFNVKESHISSLFANIFPLLESMNN